MSDNWPAGTGRVVLAEVDSTNTEAARRASGLTAPVWILGLHQTKGRGRRGRAWSDPTGNFAATYAFRPTVPPAQAALYSFVAALALQDALVAAVGLSEGFALKWPNDVLLNGGKLAGILLEGSGAGQSVQLLSIGIGVNLLQAPAWDGQGVPPVALLPETGVHMQPEAFLNLLAVALDHWKTLFDREGFAPVRTAWLARAARLGEQITARTVTCTHQGIFEGVDTSGALLLRTSSGQLAIPAAEVFF